MIPNLFKKKTLATLALGGALSIAAIACGTDDGAPASGGNPADGDSSVPTPPPSTVQSGFGAARLALEAKGAAVLNIGEEPSGTFDNPLTRLLINGQKVDLYEFASTSDADAAAATVSSDGSTIISGNTPPIAIDFLSPPHYFQQDDLIVVYTDDDPEVIQLLRDVFGEEFAGDKTPVDPNAPSGDDPGYETVLAPAPIESVVLIEDEDNPGFFLLQVASGLPGGCASFHDWNVEQTGELELTLTVLNRVPAPDQLVACTRIYGIAEHTIPLGSAEDNLDACEVYTVRWQNQGNFDSLRFQVTAPNIRCANPDDGGDGPVVTPLISDLDALILSLRAAGIDIEIGNEKGSSLFGVNSQVVTINGERIELFSFGPGDGSIRAASGVSSDGFQIGDGKGTVTFLSWISTPHFYLAGNSILLYVGVNDEIISVLDVAAGQKFAGPDSKSVEDPGEVPGPIPLPPQLAPVIVPAPIVRVGDVVIAESFPPQYFIEITSAQPSGCERDAGWEVEIDGNNVTVDVLNSQPADLSIVLCAAIYGETIHNVRLGSAEFESGVEYNLTVNGVAQDSFIAQ